jgi:toxin ParE1/3/4
MMDHRVSIEAESDLDEIWLYIAQNSSTLNIADRFIEFLTDRFSLLARNPYIGRRRDEELRPGIRSLAVRDYIILYRIDNEEVLILRVLRGNRDIEALFRQ